MVDLRTTLGPLTLRNPVLAAAGTFGYGTEFAKAVPLRRLGAVLTKTLTLAPRLGNPPPRLVVTPSGLLNAVGLQNIGLDAFLREKLPELAGHDVPVIVSILAESAGELAEMAGRLQQADGVAAVELNLSCPNLKKIGERRASARVEIVAQDPEATLELVRAARAVLRKPLIAKLSPDVTDLTPVAQAASRGGADILTLGNTFVGMSLDAGLRRSRLGAATGGLSGPAIRPLMVYRVWYTAQSVSLPIIGLGGIVRAEDAVEFFLAGASAVAIGAATFGDPRALIRVLDGLERYCRRHGLASPAELRGRLAIPAAAVS
jgi:dihydroorotate dehydrogenase (NAD+) catalytic subunit